jgi:hypothetical protein
MSNKKLTFEQAVRSGRDFRCIETLEIFRNHCEETLRTNNTDELMVFCKDWLDQTFEIIEVKKELTASEIEEAFCEAARKSPFSTWEHIAREMTKKLGF